MTMGVFVKYRLSGETRKYASFYSLMVHIFCLTFPQEELQREMV